MKVKCYHCKHQQDYKGKMSRYTCSDCGQKVYLKKMKGGKDGKDKN